MEISRSRKERWEARGQGKAPKGPVNPRYKGLDGEEMYRDLQSLIGILSDYAVHFTPEHALGYEWVQYRTSDGVVETAFGAGEDRVPVEFLMLVDQHRLLLRVFDRCLNRRLLGHPAVNEVANRAMRLYREMLRKEGLVNEAETVGETW